MLKYLVEVYDKNINLKPFVYKSRDNGDFGWTSLLGLIHTRHFGGQHCDKNIFLGHGCQQAKVSAYQIIMQGKEGFDKRLPWLFNRTLLLKMSNIALFFLIEILCAEMPLVNKALQRIVKCNVVL